MSFESTVGSRAKVWNGTAKKTSGGLHKKDLFRNKLGRIVSLSKHKSASKEMRLEQYGYCAEKGKFVPGGVPCNAKKVSAANRAKGISTPDLARPSPSPRAHSAPHTRSKCPPGCKKSETKKAKKSPKAKAPASTKKAKAASPSQKQTKVKKVKVCRMVEVE